jgi:hypothetical protein
MLHINMLRRMNAPVVFVTYLQYEYVLRAYCNFSLSLSYYGSKSKLFCL